MIKILTVFPNNDAKFDNVIVINFYKIGTKLRQNNKYRDYIETFHIPHVALSLSYHIVSAMWHHVRLTHGNFV